MRDLVQTDHCPNCGFQPFATNFCPECGQRRLRLSDLRIRSLFTDFFRGLLNLEHSLLSTFREFFVRPAHYVFSYNRGARKKYLPPFKLFLFANAFYFLFPAVNTFTTSLDIQLEHQMYSSLFNHTVESFIAGSELSRDQFFSEYNDLTFTLSKALLILLPLLFGICTWITSFSRNNRKPLIFHLNRSFIFNSFILLMVVSILPGTIYFTLILLGFQDFLLFLNDRNITIGSLLIMNWYGYLVYKGFFQTSPGLSILRTFLLNGIFFLLIVFYRFILLWVTLGWMKLF